MYMKQADVDHRAGKINRAACIPHTAQGVHTMCICRGADALSPVEQYYRFEQRTTKHKI